MQSVYARWCAAHKVSGLAAARFCRNFKIGPFIGKRASA
jgi:hypothetical protein